MHRRRLPFIASVALLGALACKPAFTEPAIPMVGEPGTFRLERLNPSGPVLAGTATIAPADEVVGFARFFLQAGAEEIVLLPNLFGPPSVVAPAAGVHRLSAFGGERGWSLAYRIIRSGADDIFAFSVGGSFNITELDASVMRGTIDATFGVVTESGVQTFRLRGSFWATATPAIAAGM